MTITKTRYPLAESSWDAQEVDAIKKLADLHQTTMGAKVFEFERAFAAYVGSRYAVMVNSGSSANLLMIASLFYTNSPKLQRGDEVIVPAVSWPTTYYPLYQYGLKLKFVDVSTETLNFDLDALEAAITPKTKAILAVNLLGNPNDFDRLQALIQDKNIILLEDNCESLGATFKGKQAGTFGLMGTFSGFFSHHISTMEGGVIVTDDEHLRDILVCLRSHGWTRHLGDDNTLCQKSAQTFEEAFRFILPGYNVRPLEMSGATGLTQLQKLPEFLKIRRENARYFQERFQDHPDLMIQQEIGQSSWFGFALMIRPESTLKRSELVQKLEAHQIDCRPIVAGNFVKNKVLSYFDYEISGDLRQADYIDQQGFFVGNHQFDIKDKIDYLVQVLNA
ncbi:MAG: DegT/DnrJ/EryC1/StrS family aminotransferase [Vampirovibrio sp.]